VAGGDGDGEQGGSSLTYAEKTLDTNNSDVFRPRSRPADRQEYTKEASGRRTKPGMPGCSGVN
jgi:hypothetical protein